MKENLDQYYFYMLDIIDSKLYRSTTATKKTSPKNICVINFQNKAIEHIKLSKILNEPDVISQLPMELQNKENRPIITYKLSSTIRNKIFNYKDTVNSIYFDDEISFALNTDPCQCSKSPFIDSHHKHVITGDLRIVENAKLRKLLTKGPNYREPRSINFNKAVTEITAGLENCIENLANKTKYDKKTFDQWKKIILEKIFLKVEKLKSKMKFSFTKPALSDPNVLSYLQTLHRKYVIVPIDKASNNFAFICKHFYISKILSEVSENNNNQPNLTYSKINCSKEDIINNNENFCKKFDLKLTEKD